MHVTVRRVGYSEPHEVDADADTTIQKLKETLPPTISLGAEPAAMHLVYGGTVISSESRISELALEDSPTLWLLVSDSSESTADRAYGYGVHVAEKVNRSGIVPLKCMQPNCEQTIPASMHASMLRELSDMFVEDSARWRPRKSERDELCAAIAALESSAPSFQRAPHISWFGAYGCALLATVPRVGTVHLRLVCLDQWAFRMHPICREQGRAHTADAHPDASITDHVGHIALDHYADFMCALATPHLANSVLRRALLARPASGRLHVTKLLEKADQRKGDKRSAASNDQGNQKTPAMIKAVLIDALAGAEDGVTPPRGGFTDVGLHTGGHKRSTSWPLVRAVLQALLEDSGHELFYRHAMAQMKLLIAENAARAFYGVNFCQNRVQREAHAIAIDSCMQALTAAVQEGANLADEQTHVRGGSQRKLDMDAFEARCVFLRWQLEQAAHERANQIANQFRLPPLSESDLKGRNLVLTPPASTFPAQGPDGLSAARAKAEANLIWLPAPPADSTVLKLKQWLKHPRLQPGQGAVSALLVLETVERKFFDLAATLNRKSVGKVETDLKHSKLWVQHVEKVVDRYRKVANAFRVSSEAGALLTVERSSRELLVVWSAYCWVHKATLPFEFEVLGEFGVPLRPSDLQHLVLSAKHAIDAAQHITAYLRGHTKLGGGVFSLRPSDCTFDLASLHSNRSPDTQALWKLEQTAAATRKAEHWRIVLEKQAKLRTLDQELATSESRLSSARRARDCYHRPAHWTSNDNNTKWRKHDSEVDTYSAEVAQTEAHIRSTEIPPPAIFQPLPQSQAAAMPVVFFLTMPTHFQVLSRLSFTAQQQLLPSSRTIVVSTSNNEIDVAAAIKEDVSKSSWRNYYLGGSTTRHLTDAVDTKVLLESDHVVPQSTDFSPNNVRHFSSSTVGIWHPDSLVPRLVWTGGRCALDERGGEFNPFAQLPDSVYVVKFTELLPSDHRVMQWAMIQHGAASESSRGNVPEARQDIKPDWLAGKTEFFGYGAMRAYPNQQVRKICVALHDRAMPLDHPAVRKLLQATLFHLGEFSDGIEPRPKWRTDLAFHGGWEALRLELHSLADELQLKPRQHGAVLILGELAAHASQWDASSRDVARWFAKIAQDWAHENIESAPSSKVPQLRARRCLFSMYVIICQGAGELSSADITALCEAILLADYNRLFEDPSPLDAIVRELTVVTQEVIARRLPELLDTLDRDGAPLTEGVRCVLEALTPNALQWKRVQYDGQKTACFEAVSPGKEPHLFSINIQTGVVLYDGQPPSRLPQTILSLPLYKRSFTDRNFEVVLAPSGILKTVRLQGGFRYDFYVNAAGKLTVHEIDPESPDAPLELLDGTEARVDEWGEQLPIRLQQMHSHWYCRSMNAVILRSKLFHLRDVDFILVDSDTLPSFGREELMVTNIAGNPGWLCFRVPDHQAKLKWFQSAAYIDNFDQLVLPAPSQVLTVLSKFETDPDLVHVYYTAPDHVLVCELPRFDLAFELDFVPWGHGSLVGRLKSRNFSTRSTDRICKRTRLELSLTAICVRELFSCPSRSWLLARSRAAAV